MPRRLRLYFPDRDDLRSLEQGFSTFAILTPTLSPYHNGGLQVVQSQGRTPDSDEAEYHASAIRQTRMVHAVAADLLPHQLAKGLTGKEASTRRTRVRSGSFPR